MASKVKPGICRDGIMTAPFYKKMFVEDKTWSTPWPNFDEARRWAVLLPWLADICYERYRQDLKPPKILDVGCGRGWMTRLASVFGECAGVDPIQEVIQYAREIHPGIKFNALTPAKLLREPAFQPYDVVLCSEVLEHVPYSGQSQFVKDLVRLVHRGGYLLVTTPRGKWRRKWNRLGFAGQPVEDWLDEKDAKRLFQDAGGSAVRYDRVYISLPRLSFLHRLCVSRKFGKILKIIHGEVLRASLEYMSGFYQAWCFIRL